MPESNAVYRLAVFFEHKLRVVKIGIFGRPTRRFVDEIELPFAVERPPIVAPKLRARVFLPCFSYMYPLLG